MKTIVKRTQRDYSLAFKLSVVDQVEKGEMTYKQAQSRYGIQGRSTVLAWLRKHGRLDWSQGTPLRHGEKQMSDPLPLTPEQRIKELEQQLYETKRKAELFESIINILERDYGVSTNKKATRQAIKEKQAIGFSITECCHYLDITRQAYYKQCQQSNLRYRYEQNVLKQVRQERMFQPRIGTRKLHYLLNTRIGITIGRDRLFDLLRDHRLLVQPKRAYHKTTNSHHRFHKHPNLVKFGIGQVIPLKPEQLWVADITYLPIETGEAYLSLITDAWSRKIVGYHVDDNLGAEAVSQAYIKALKERKAPQYSLIHHSDRGIQYCSKKYQELHQKYNIRCSMTDGYDCYQNALAERVNGILKNEYLLHKPRNLEEARRMVAESIEIYNVRRPHMSLKYKTPDEMHQAFV
ncbi:IS3 family transposase [Acinetobacter bereziniae]|uniref:IS3 family transposase n=1 Tax=Acinetobacter bereziniae TaxID=106648 RepID=UPI0028147092|nr:IS3 family transposase [Acinetobacter bereziniae]MDQ9818935.1 IS3 family transposase [Acinetobacter bereziniae]